MKAEMKVHCVVMVDNLKTWDGEKYCYVNTGDDLALPKSIARQQARDGVVRIVNPHGAPSASE